MNAIAPITPEGLTVRVTAMPMIDPGRRRIVLDLPHGMTLAQIVATAMPLASEDVLWRTRVQLVTAEGSCLVERALWRQVRPYAHVHVVIRVVPAGPAGGAILGLLVQTGASAIAGPIASFFNLSAFGKGLLTFGLTAAGGLLLNLLMAPKSPKKERETFAVTGWRNEFVPVAPVPIAFGRIRYAPRHAAYYYTEIVGDDVYTRAVFNLGYGPVAMSDMRLGDTPIEKFDGITVETRQGLSDDAPLTLYPRQVIEESGGADLTRPPPVDDLGNPTGGPPVDKPVSRFGAQDAEEACLIFAFQEGLVGYKKPGFFSKGGPRARSVYVRIRYRLEGEGDWSEGEVIVFTEQRQTAFFRAHRWTYPERGRYEIEVTRLSEESGDPNIRDRITLFAVQSFRPEYPFNFAKPHALVAMRAKGSAQLNGTVDNFNCIVERIAPDLAGDAWVEQVTTNCSSAALFVLRRPVIAYPVPDEKIDWPAFAAWHAFCVEKNLNYNRVHDFEGGLEDVLKAIGAAGRAWVRNDGVKWTVVIDRPRDIIVDHVSARNASEFKWAASYFKPPHAIRVPFLDEEHQYRAEELIVPWPPDARYATRSALYADLDHPAGRRAEVHSDPDPVKNGYYEKSGSRGEGAWAIASMDVTDEREHPGKTNAAEIWREERRLQYEQVHRSVNYQATQDHRVRTATPGDQLMMARDVLAAATHSGRVLAVEGRRVLVDADFAMEAGGEYAIRFRRFTPENTIGTSHLSRIDTMPGSTALLTVQAGAEMPAEGDLVQFGPAASDSLPVILVAPMRGNDGTTVLNMLPAAPIIDELTDAEVMPSYSVRVGYILTPEEAGDDQAPATPRIKAVSSTIDRGAGTAVLTVALAPGVGAVAVATYEVRHRLAGDLAWDPAATGWAGGGAVDIAGYAIGDDVEMQARAVSGAGVPSPWGPLVTYGAGSDFPGLPLALAGFLVTGGLGSAAMTVIAGADGELMAVQIYRRDDAGAVDAGDAILSPLLLSSGASAVTIAGDPTRSNQLGASIGFAAAGWTLGANWSDGGDRATHAAGATAALSKPVTIDAGQVARIAVAVEGRTSGTLTPSLEGGAGVDGSAIAANGETLLKLTADSGVTDFALTPSSDFDGSVVAAVLYVETAICLPQGGSYFSAQPLNDDSEGGPISGPVFATII